MRTVHVVLPNDIDDPATPSGGNAYDRRICRGLAATGWSVREHPVRGSWPRPAGTERAGLARVLAELPDDATVLLDGLVASAAPAELAPHAHRLRMAVLVHMPLGGEAEAAALAAAGVVVSTSAWSRQRLLDLYDLPGHRVHVAAPGVQPAPLAPASDSGTRLLCVAAVAPHKGHDLLVQALSNATDLPWTCVCAGPLTVAPRFVDELRQRVEAYGLAGRVSLIGPRTGDQLAAEYAAADLMVLASRGETYGMVVTEALARGLPVLATAVHGLPEAMGSAADGSLPGMLVRPDDPVALAGAVRRWLTDAELRGRLRRSARDRRATLPGWEATCETMSTVLQGLSAAHVRLT